MKPLSEFENAVIVLDEHFGTSNGKYKSQFLMKGDIII